MPANKTALLALAAFAALCHPARAIFSFSTSGGAADAKITAAAHAEPAITVAGSQGAIILEIESPADTAVENLQVSGLPDPPLLEYLADSLETLPQIAAQSNRVVHVFRLPFRASAPAALHPALTIAGMATLRRQTGNFSFSSSNNFQTRTAAFPITVEALPEAGKPRNFSGAVGSRFEFTRQISKTAVHPGDLLTATFTLRHDGYFPSNCLPQTVQSPGNFKTYPLKEISRRRGEVKWTQIIVPQSAAATNTPALTFNYYDPAAKRYATATAAPIALKFVSAEAAPAENTAVIVSDSGDVETAAQRAGGDAPIILHFAPSANSPAIAVLPAGTEVRELETHNGWRRVAAPKATGWMKPGE